MKPQAPLTTEDISPKDQDDRPLYPSAEIANSALSTLGDIRHLLPPPDYMQYLGEAEQNELKDLLCPSDLPSSTDFDPSHVTQSLTELLDIHFEGKKEIIDSISAWVAEDGARIIDIEVELAALVREHDLTLSALAMLGQIHTFRDRVLVDDELMKQWEDHAYINLSLQNQLRTINRVNQPGPNRQARKIWNFVLEYITTVQNDLDRDMHSQKKQTLCTDFFNLANQELPFAQNYLVLKELEEVCDSQFPDDNLKEGAIAGLPGGATDQTIYTYHHTQESYTNRLALGINEGYPIAQPVLKISPDYYGFYQNGQLQKVFSASDYDPQSAQDRQNALLAQNSPEDGEWVYDSLSKPLHPDRTHIMQKGLSKLQDLWDFEDELQETGHSHFFDISRIDQDKLHPGVYATVLTENAKYLHTVEGTENRAKPISIAEFAQHLTPNSVISHEEVESYLGLMSLRMRKKIEDDFGIDLANCSLWIQKSFLAYLEGQDIQTVERVQQFTKEFGYKGLSVFLSLEEGNPTSEATIFKLLDSVPADLAPLVVEKFADLVNTSESARTYLKEHFGAVLADKPDLHRALVANLLKRGRTLLETATHSSAKPTSLLKELDSCNADLLLFANVFRGTYGQEFNLEQFKELQLEHRKGGELSQDEYDQMLVIADTNWSELSSLMPGMHQQIMHDLPAQLRGEYPKNGLPLDTTWHLMKRGNKVLGFFRLDSTSDGYYFGSMNTSPELQGFKIGDAILRETLTKAADGKPVSADSSPKTAICRSYINKYGFVGTNLSPYKETGEILLGIEMNTGASYQLQGKTFAELDAIQSDQVKEYTFNLTYRRPEDPEAQAWENEGGTVVEDPNHPEYARFLRESAQQFAAGKVMTAFVADSIITPSQTYPEEGYRRFLVAFEDYTQPKE